MPCASTAFGAGLMYLRSMSDSPVFSRSGSLAGVVLAGGESKRFGSDKLAVEIDGVAMLHRVIRAVKVVVPDVYVSIGSTAISADVVRSSGCPVIRDEMPGLGPIGGLYSVIRQLDYDWILVVAGDMPFMTSECLTSLISKTETQTQTQTETENCDAIVATDHGGRLHPLVGCYASSTLPKIEECISAKKYAMKALISSLDNVRYVTFGDKTLRNMNRLEDIRTGSFE